MKFKKNFYISLGNLNSSKPELSKWYLLAGPDGVLLIFSEDNLKENVFNRRFILNNYAH